MSELKPCPFCGCDKIYKAYDVHPKCSKCGAVQDDAQGLLAVEKLNERVVDNQLAKQQEEIAEYREKLKQIADATVYNFNYETAKPIYDLLAKHNKGE